MFGWFVSREKRDQQAAVAMWRAEFAALRSQPSYEAFCALQRSATWLKGDRRAAEADLAPMLHECMQADANRLAATISLRGERALPAFRELYWMFRIEDIDPSKLGYSEEWLLDLLRDAHHWLAAGYLRTLRDTYRFEAYNRLRQLLLQGHVTYEQLELTEDDFNKLHALSLERRVRELREDLVLSTSWDKFDRAWREAWILLQNGDVTPTRLAELGIDLHAPEIHAYYLSRRVEVDRRALQYPGSYDCLVALRRSGAQIADPLTIYGALSR